jgi:ornithine cyclodeaminase/alanine dehydrogenase-like protein (mu-crystallin family)
VLFVDAHTVRRVFPMKSAIELMAETMRRYSAGRVSQPLRTILRPQTESGLLGTMPCHVDGPDYAGFGLKAMVLKPENPTRGLDLHIGVVIVFDQDTGRPLAVIDAGEITAIRTAAVSAVATEALAAPDAGDLAILGSGVQARGHLEAMAIVRDLRRVRVWSRTAEHAKRFRDWAGSQRGIVVEVAPSVPAALEGADLICTTTASKEPIVEKDWLTPGCHLNVVGGSFADFRELSSAAVANAVVFVDSRESAIAESGDLLAPLREGLIGPDHVVAELGEVLLGKHRGRTTEAEITLYKSLGLAVQDVMSGFFVARAAGESGV